MTLREHDLYVVVDSSVNFFTSTAAVTRRHELTGSGVSDDKQAWAADRKKGNGCVKCEIREVSK